MKYQRYFKAEQQLLLRVENDVNQDGRTELLTVHVVSCDDSSLRVSFPYGADAVDQYPFREGMPFEVSGEALGMGIRVTASFAKKNNSSEFTLSLDSDLQVFQRRISQRFDCQLGIRFSRAAKTLQTMREIWERNLEVLYSPEAPLIYEGFNPARVNISSGGIRLSVKPPANQGELCLIMINLDDGKPPVCAIAEVVWMCVQDEDVVTAGMRFINILGDDQKRIDDFIEQSQKT